MHEAPTLYNISLYLVVPRLEETGPLYDYFVVRLSVNIIFLRKKSFFPPLNNTKVEPLSRS